VFSFRDVTNIEVMCNIYIFNLNLKIFKNKYYGFSCGSEFLKYSQFLHVLFLYLIIYGLSIYAILGALYRVRKHIFIKFKIQG
jgi:hypothetical protein